jgi:glycine/D-amino acid oxidase-like deaminating enzyme
MDLKSGYPFWAVKNGLMTAFPRLEEDATCEVLVIGAGITGALIACALAREHLDVIVVEQRDIAWGSTAASTALLQYEIDTHLIDLQKKYGHADAVKAYRACADAITMLRDIAAQTRDVGFKTTDSLYVASSRFHRSAMRDEFDARERNGLPVKWLDRDELNARFGIDAPCAILSSLAAQVDPYRMASRILAKLSKRSVRIFDRSPIDTVTTTSRVVHARTRSGTAIRAGHVIVASGYAAQHWLRTRVAKNRSSYAFVTDPIGVGTLGVWSNTLLWESARPYLYARSTSDARLLIGGEDDLIDIPARRDARVDKKSRTLMKGAARFFPHLELTPAFAWAGTFAETDDGLPFFGAHEQWGPRVLFAMAYGGNGITYSVIGADLLAATVKRRAHPLRRLFGFERLNW